MNNFTELLKESTEIATIKTADKPVIITQFGGGKDVGLNIQIGQGFGKYIQVGPKQALEIAKVLVTWAKKQK